MHFHHGRSTFKSKWLASNPILMRVCNVAKSTSPPNRSFNLDAASASHFHHRNAPQRQRWLTRSLGVIEGHHDSASRNSRSLASRIVFLHSLFSHLVCGLCDNWVLCSWPSDGGNLGPMGRSAYWFWAHSRHDCISNRAALLCWLCIAYTQVLPVAFPSHIFTSSRRLSQ